MRDNRWSTRRPAAFGNWLVVPLNARAWTNRDRVFSARIILLVGAGDLSARPPSSKGVKWFL